MRVKSRTQRIDEALAKLDEQLEGPLTDDPATLHQLCTMVPTISKKEARKRILTWQLQLGRSSGRLVDHDD